MKDYSKIHEWELSILHSKALKSEDYETCSAIQKEIDKRIIKGTINHSLMQGFRRYDPKKETFIGSPNYEGLNGLFDKYHNAKGG